MDPLLTRFLARLRPELLERARGREVALAEVLTRATTEATAAHPDVRSDPAALAEALAGRLPPDDDPVEALPRVRAADLFLATATLAGDPVAQGRFERFLSAEVDAAAASVRAAPSVADEVKQRLRTGLLVGEGERGPALADYAARGDLRGFLRVSAVRECLRMAKRAQREVGLAEDALAGLAPALDPELERLKARYRQEFTESFVEAVKALAPRERTLLRHHVLDRLTIDQIGQIYGVHRATAARRLERARARVAELTEALLAERLSLGTDEVASVIRLVRSQLEVSLERLLDEDH